MGAPLKSTGRTHLVLRRHSRAQIVRHAHLSPISLLQLLVPPRHRTPLVENRRASGGPNFAIVLVDHRRRPPPVKGDQVREARGGAVAHAVVAILQWLHLGLGDFLVQEQVVADTAVVRPLLLARGLFLSGC